ncbi:hypothetical protein FACS18949_08550 [Clostridia bacterium]|nr:hypothetical protein FACS18949_08550 [Clostridia bacterium]
MNTEKLLYGIGDIDDDFIAEANARKRPRLKRLLAAAACVAVSAAVIFIPQLSVKYPSDEAPKLTVNMEFDTMGFEAYMAYNISELANGNPWRESDFLSAFYVADELSAEEMANRAKETARTMGLTIDSLYVSPTEEELRKETEKTGEPPESTTPYRATATCGNVEVRAESDGRVRVFFGETVELPQGTAEEMTAYLLEQYAYLTRFEVPALDVSSQYTYDGKLIYSYSAYEGADDKLLGYNFNRVNFSLNEQGRLWVIDLWKADLHNIGAYRTISAKEARKLLLEKHYVTSVPYAVTDAKNIAGVELVYRTGSSDSRKVFMPYYRFLVELPDMQRDNGLKTYGAYYVPAVKAEYLNN